MCVRGISMVAGSSGGGDRRPGDVSEAVSLGCHICRVAVILSRVRHHHAPIGLGNVSANMSRCVSTDRTPWFFG